MAVKLEGKSRFVVLQTLSQSQYYATRVRKSNDVVIPIGPQAMHEASRLGWCSIALSDLWDEGDYRQTSEKSSREIIECIEALNDFSGNWSPALELRLGDYYSFQLSIILGQLHYNLFIVQSLARYIADSKLVVFTKKNDERFLDLRPDPDCVFADVLINSDVIDPELVELIYIDEKRTYNTPKEKLLGLLPSMLVRRLREARRAWQLYTFKKTGKRLLLVGGGYDWVKISSHRVFRDQFSISGVHQPSTKAADTKLVENILSVLSDRLPSHLGSSVSVNRLAISLASDLRLFSEHWDEIKTKIEGFDAVVTSVLTFPWDSYLAHMAAVLGKPVVLWQHGEKGQSIDPTALYTELMYTTHYLAYAEGVANLYKPFVGTRRLAKVSVVGSLGKAVTWEGGETILYATGKWFKTCSPMLTPSDPDRRLFTIHKAVLAFLNDECNHFPIIFKANNTPGLDSTPYRFENIHIVRNTPFTELLAQAKLVILDTPATTLIEACSTHVPVFVVGGRSIYTKEFLDLVKRRVVWCERVDELINQLRVFLQKGVYQADVSDRSYLDAFGAHLNADEVVRRVADSLDVAIASHK